MAVVEDEWALDPSVRMMRKIFGRIEAAQNELLRHLSISHFDTRLAPWREHALKSFEKTWVQANKYGITLGEEQFATIYIHCLAHAMNNQGIESARDAFPTDEKITMLLKETLS